MIEINSNTIDKLINITINNKSKKEIHMIFKKLNIHINNLENESKTNYLRIMLLEINKTDSMNYFIEEIINFILIKGSKDEIDELEKILNFDGYKIIYNKDNKAKIIEKNEIYSNGDELLERLLKYKYDDEFLKNVISDNLLLDIINIRMIEVRKSILNDLPLACIILSGSILEGLLLYIANRYPAKFNKANAAPKNNGVVKKFSDWSLSEFINASYELDILDLDVKIYCHNLRDFRNYIHPNKQLESKFIPNIDTAKISYQVLIASINQISKYITQTKNDTIS